MTSGSFRSVSRPRNRRKSQSARLRVLASQSEVALDRSETFLRNQDPKRTSPSTHVAAANRFSPYQSTRLSARCWLLGGGHEAARIYLGYLAVRRPRGRSRRARSSPTDAAHRRALPASLRTITEFQARIAAFQQGLQQLGWTDGRNVRIDIRWATAMPLKFADTRRNWSRSHRTSSWPMAPRPGAAATGRPAPYRSCSSQVTDPVGAALSEAWRNRVAMPLVSRQVEYGLSGKWLEAAEADRAERDASWRSSADPAVPSGSGNSAPSSLWHRLWNGGKHRSTCAMPARWSARWRHSRAPRMAG